MLALDTDALRSAHARHRATLPAEWPVAASTAALEALLASGLPDMRTEAWRYTNLGGLAARLAGQSGTPATAPGAEPSLTPVTGDGVLVEQRDGRCVSPLPTLPPGLSAGNAGATIATGTGGLPLVDLNTAFAADGLALELAPGVALPRPLVLRDRALDPAAVSQPRRHLRLGAGSSLTVIELVTGAAGACANSLGHIALADGAQLELVRIHAGGAGATRLDRLEIELGRDAGARLTLIDAGTGLCRQDLVVRLTGDGSRVDVGGLCIGGAGTHVDHHVSIEHAAHRTTSRVQYRGVADHGGRVVFNGRVLVAAGASGTDAALNNRNLLLSPGAEIDTKPELEIYTDDVRCSHGATTGQLDPAALFYLQSRGLPADEARRLLIGAFTGEIVTRIAPPAVAAAATDRVRAALEPA